MGHLVPKEHMYGLCALSRLGLNWMELYGVLERMWSVLDKKGMHGICLDMLKRSHPFSGNTVFGLCSY